MDNQRLTIVSRNRKQPPPSTPHPRVLTPDVSRLADNCVGETCRLTIATQSTTPKCTETAIEEPRVGALSCGSTIVTQLTTLNYKEGAVEASRVGVPCSC